MLALGTLQEPLNCWAVILPPVLLGAMHAHLPITSDPAGQGMHALLEPACGVTEKVLAGQGMHTVDPAAA